jgi:15-cis-phytoene synthase
MRFGRTYYLATMLLPPAKRPYVHSLYGFARYADEIVDNDDRATRGTTFRRWTEHVLADLGTGHCADPICWALSHTSRTWGLEGRLFEAFLGSMLMDLTVTEYPTYSALEHYMYGSAAVIGLQMTAILEPLDEEAYPRAQALGEAFQLTNFLRDVAEDLRRGRIYLPQEDLAGFGVTRADLAAGRVTAGVRELLRFEIARTRRLYEHAYGGIGMLAPSSRDCVETAYRLYGAILDEIERADYQIFDHRVSVGLARRAGVAIPHYLHARHVRFGAGHMTASIGDR